MAVAPITEASVVVVLDAAVVGAGASVSAALGAGGLVSACAAAAGRNTPMAPASADVTRNFRRVDRVFAEVMTMLLLRFFAYQLEPTKRLQCWPFLVFAAAAMS
jgi:hypothetical protein